MSFPSYASAACNIVAALVLIGALIPPFLDTKRSRKTFPIAEKFFLFYTCGSITMFINGVTNIISSAGAVGAGDVVKLIMFCVLTTSNAISSVLNSWMWKVKRQNVKNAEAANLTEQEYWTTVIQKQLELA